jgi:spoIIIJ-associated protein
VEEFVETARQIMMGLLEKMEINAELKGSLTGRDIYLEVRGNQHGILIGRHGRTLDSLQFLINRMVNKRLKEPVKVILDVNDYRKKREENLKKIAIRSGEKVKWRGFSLTIGPFNACDRRIIHLALKEDPLLRTESLGEGEIKRIKIIPSKNEGAKSLIP